MFLFRPVAPLVSLSLLTPLCSLLLTLCLCRHVDEIKTITELAGDLGVKATPTFYIGSKRLTGVPKIEEVKQLLGL